MSELKNLIIVDITDYEDIVLSPSGIGATGEHVIKEIKGRGTLLIKNTSQKSRLWNLICDLKEIVNTNMNKMLNVGSVNPSQEFKQEYEIQNLQEPCLKVVETFDTERDLTERINNTFLYENTNKCGLKIALTNTLNLPFTEITVVREIPQFCQDIEIKSASSGNADIKFEGVKRFLNWKVESLAGGATATIEVFCTVTAKERKDYSLGSLKINYLIDNKHLTMINPEVRGETDSMSGVTRNEGSKPGSWDCNVEFINDSEFRVRLEDVRVDHKIPTGTETIVSEKPNVELDTDKMWDKNFQIESPNVPDLESEITFTPLYEVITRIIGEIIKEPTYYNVLSAEVHKAINPPEVAAYANTNMTIENSIPNKGTSVFDTLQVIDEIPPDFIPPTMKGIRIVVKNPQGNFEIQERKEFIKGVDVTPNDQNPDIKHEINIRLKNLEKEVPAGSVLIVTYPLLAKNPKPEVKYGTPVQIKVNVPVKGNKFVITDLDEPELKIKYVKRKLRTLKSVKPGLAEGEFNITLRIQNKGDVELENIVVKDKIPSGFTLSETNFNLPYEVKEGAETVLEVKIVELEGNESTDISYSCSGSGDYPRSEPQIIVLGREITAEGPSIQTDRATVASSKQGAVHEVFVGIFKSIEEGITGAKLGELLEEKRDVLPPGPILHQFLQFAKEVKDHGEKVLVGGLRDEIEAKLNDFKSRYV